MNRIPDPACPEQIAQIFGALLIEGWLENDLSPFRAFELGKKAGHYGLIALAHQEQMERGFAAIRGAFGGAQ